jgi:hypothetical protein
MDDDVRIPEKCPPWASASFLQTLLTSPGVTNYCRTHLYTIFGLKEWNSPGITERSQLAPLGGSMVLDLALSSPNAPKVGDRIARFSLF